MDAPDAKVGHADITIDGRITPEEMGRRAAAAMGNTP